MATAAQARDAVMHHACVKHVVDSINSFCDKDVHVLCADNKVKLGYPCLSLDEHCAEWVITGYPRCVAAEDTLTPCAWTGPRWPLTAAAPREAALHAGAPTTSLPALQKDASIEGLLMCSPSWRARRMSCQTQTAVHGPPSARQCQPSTMFWVE